MAEITTTIKDNMPVFVVSVNSGTETVLKTADTYCDKDIVIQAHRSGGPTGELLLQDKIVNPSLTTQLVIPDPDYDALSSVRITPIPIVDQGEPIAIKGQINNHSMTITPAVMNEEGYVTGGSVIGEAIQVSASELVSDNLNITLNQEYDITNYASITSAVPPCIYAVDNIFTQDDTRQAEFILPSQPRAWFLMLGSSTASTMVWDNKYRCMYAYYDGNKIVWYNSYKRNGNQTPYFYKCTTGASQAWDEENHILTITVDTAGNQTYAGPFWGRQYNLFAICDNFGIDQILINMIRNETDNITDEDREILYNQLNNNP